MVINLADPDLFGNDNAEDEDANVLESYFLPRPEYLHLKSVADQIAIVRAYKGEGKSALLRMLRVNLEPEAARGDLVLIECAATDIAPSIETTDPIAWIQAWKETLSRRIVGAIGSKIGFAASDDATLLVDEAIRQGWGARGFVSYIASRLRVKGQSVVERKPGLANPEALLQRWQKSAIPVWVIIDDIDFNYEDKQRDKCRIGQFFSACRSLSSSIAGLRFRLSVRPNVWTSVRLRFEDLNKLEQYTRALNWETEDLRGLIASRVKGYLQRRNLALPTPIHPPELEEKRLVAMAFEDPMAWGSLRSPEVPLTTMSWNRPRWLVELCKEAGRRAVRNDHNRIMLRDLENVLSEFGARRFADTAAEFRVRCPQVTHLMDAFANGAALMDTGALLRFAESKLSPVAPTIDGNKTSDPIEICGFLYEIGFLTARYDRPGGKYDHVRFASRPTLLRSRTDMDQGHQWEIHPVFRKHLHLRGRT